MSYSSPSAAYISVCDDASESLFWNTSSVLIISEESTFICFFPVVFLPVPGVLSDLTGVKHAVAGV